MSLSRPLTRGQNSSPAIWSATSCKFHVDHHYFSFHLKAIFMIISPPILGTRKRNDNPQFTTISLFCLHFLFSRLPQDSLPSRCTICTCKSHRADCQEFAFAQAATAAPTSWIAMWWVMGVIPMFLQGYPPVKQTLTTEKITTFFLDVMCKSSINGHLH
jgi:hypothetical protein